MYRESILSKFAIIASAAAALSAAFVTLKLTDVLSWSWWWLSPLVLPLAVLAFVLVLWLFLAVVVAVKRVANREM